MSDSDSTVQSNFENDQSYEIDIDKMYTDFITAIDNHRSYVNVTNQNASNLLSSITGDSSAPTANNLQPAAVYQESRCHAFYRMIGFPVVAQDKRFYNPGLDIIVDETRSITLDTKKSIATSPLDGFVILSLERETYAQVNGKPFTTPNTIDAAVLSLSGGANPKGIRKFSSPYTNSDDPFDTDPTNQRYSIDLTSKVGEYDILLSNYQDSSGATPTELSAGRSHIIKPFVVDPRIDFTVSPKTDSKSAPSSRLVCVPFAPTKAQTKVSSNSWADPPMIETIIRDRFTVTDQSANSGASTQDLIDFIKTVPAINDQTLITQISKDDITSTSQISKFQEYLNIIQVLMQKVVEAQNDILSAQSLYYWVPVPSANGPEGGSTIQGIFLPTLIDPKLVTPNDLSILLKTAQSILSSSNQNPDVAKADGSPDPGSFAQSFKTFMDSRSSAAFIDSAGQTLDALTKKRNSLLTKAGDALRTIEIIMGEFSGLGLCDIIAIMAALYVMPANSLLGFLDSDSFDRMEAELSTGVSKQSLSLQQAMTDFSSYVKQFYTVMDDVYQDLANNNGLSTS